MTIVAFDILKAETNNDQTNWKDNFVNCLAKKSWNFKENHIQQVSTFSYSQGLALNFEWKNFIMKKRLISFARCSW